MKNLLIATLCLFTTLSHADCSLFVKKTVFGCKGKFKDEKAVKLIKKSLEKKDYIYSEEMETDYSVGLTFLCSVIGDGQLVGINALVEVYDNNKKIANFYNHEANTFFNKNVQERALKKALKDVPNCGSL